MSHGNLTSVEIDASVGGDEVDAAGSGAQVLVDQGVGEIDVASGVDGDDSPQIAIQSVITEIDVAACVELNAPNDVGRPGAQVDGAARSPEEKFIANIEVAG